MKRTVDLAGKVVFVAGASSGIGRAVARAAAEAGAKVALFARSSDVLAQLHDELVAAGLESMPVPGDATDPTTVSGAVHQAVARFGTVDVLVNSVGANVPDRGLPVLSLERWHELISANLHTAYILTQAVLPIMRQQRDGLLVHVASAAVKKPDVSGVGYQASKAGLAGLANATMEEERANGIRVSVVFPGMTDTPLLDRRPTPTPATARAKALQPEDVATLCLAIMALPKRAHVAEVVVLPAQL